MVNWRELSKGCVKGFLLSLNLMCILQALCTFGFAVVDTNILKQYGQEQASGSLIGNVAIIVACVLLVGVSTFGLVAAMREHVKMLYLYVVLIMILVVLELLVAIFVSLQRYGLQFRVAEWLRDDFFSNVTEDGRLLHEKMWDDLQTGYECCGLNSPEDYAAIGHPISLSCCSRAYRARTDTAQVNMYKTCVESATYYTDGCEEEILKALETDSDWLLGVVFTTFWFEAMAMLLAMWVANNAKNSVQLYKNTVKY